MELINIPKDFSTLNKTLSLQQSKGVFYAFILNGICTDFVQTNKN